MADEILATGSTVTDSGSVSHLIAGQFVALKDASADALIVIDIQDDAGNWQQIDEIGSGRPFLTVPFPAIYRFRRVKGTCGVFS